MLERRQNKMMNAGGALSIVVIIVNLGVMGAILVGLA